MALIVRILAVPVLVFAAGVFTAQELGQRVTFWQILVFSASVDFQDDIFLGDTTGRRVRLTNAPHPDSQPTWSPDAEQIAFASQRAGSWQLYILTLEDGGITQITESITDNRTPVWSPDGEMIAFMFERVEATGWFDVFTLELASGELRNLTDTPVSNFFPSWSPDGSQLVVLTGPGQVQVLALPYGEMRVDSTSNVITRPTWSPDGDYIAFPGASDSINPGLPDAVYIQKSDGTASPVRAPVEGLQIEGVAWSPDGDHMALLAIPLNRQQAGTNVYLVTLSNGELKQLTNLPGHKHDLSWSPNGRMLMFLTDEPSQICFVGRRGGAHCPAGLAEGTDPEWRP